MITDVLTKLFSPYQNLAANILNSVPSGISITTDILCKEIRHNITASKFLRIGPWESLSYSDAKQLPVRVFHKGKELTPEKMPIQRSVWNGDEVQGMEIDFLWDDGVRKTSAWNSSPLFDDSGSIIGAVAAFEDITERKKMENELSEYRDHLETLVKERTNELEVANEKLRQEIELRKTKEAELHESQEMLRLFFENSIDGILLTTPDGGILSANPAACRMFGRTEKEICKIERSGLVDLTDPRLSKALEERERTGKSRTELRFVRRDGIKFDAEVTSVLFKDRNGRYLTSMTIRDLTESKLMEYEIQKSEKHFRTAVENMLDCFGIYSAIRDESGQIADFLIEYVNEASCKLNGLSKQEQIGKRLLEMHLTHEKHGFFYEYCKVVETGVPFVIEHTYHGEFSGYIKGAYEIRAVKLDDGFAIIWRDITERKKSEEALRLSEERFSIAFNSSPSIMSITSCRENRYIYVNNHFLQVLGYSREDVVGNRSEELGIWVDSIDRVNTVRQMLQDNKGLQGVEAKFKTKTGEMRDVLAFVNRISVNGEDCFLGVAHDLTERRLFEKEISRLDRLNLIGEMAAGIGHEIRNPMTTVKGFLQLLRERDKYAGEREFFDLMVDEVDRANSIISEFLSLAKNKSVELKSKNLNKILKSILPLIAADGLVTDKYINLETQKIPDLLLDEKEIRQLVLNLVRNGIEAMSPGGVIKIRTYSEEDEVGLSVQDNGKGIDPDVLEKLGTPFFTTKETGTGLGLAVCYSIAARHNAKIDVETGAEGTTFFVRFKKTA